MRHFNRGMMLITLIAAISVAIMTAGCSTGATAANSSAAPSTAKKSAGYKDGQVIRKCLKSYGVSKVRLKQEYHNTGGANMLTLATIKTAGEKCWKPTDTGLFATALRRVVHCLGLEGITTAHTGSPLADVLLQLEVHSTKSHNALRFCLRT
jgi:hypothetical protein